MLIREKQTKNEFTQSTQEQFLKFSMLLMRNIYLALDRDNNEFALFITKQRPFYDFLSEDKHENGDFTDGNSK